MGKIIIEINKTGDEKGTETSVKDEVIKVTHRYVELYQWIKNHQRIYKADRNQNMQTQKYHWKLSTQKKIHDVIKIIVYEEKWYNHTTVKKKSTG